MCGDRVRGISKYKLQMFFWCIEALGKESIAESMSSRFQLHILALTCRTAIESLEIISRYTDALE